MLVDSPCPRCGAPFTYEDSDFVFKVTCSGCGTSYAPSAARGGGRGAALPPGARPIPGAGPSPRADRSDRSDREEREPRRRRRGPLPDPTAALRWPANLLYIVAALELAIIVASSVVCVVVFGPDMANNGWDNLRPQARTAILVLAVGFALCAAKDVVVILGARAMRHRRRFGLAITGAVAALAPIELALSITMDVLAAIANGRPMSPTTGCSGPWALAWAGIGVWALVTLLSGPVRARFRPPSSAEGSASDTF